MSNSHISCFFKTWLRPLAAREVNWFPPHVIDQLYQRSCRVALWNDHALYRNPAGREVRGKDNDNCKRITLRRDPSGFFFFLYVNVPPSERHASKRFFGSQFSSYALLYRAIVRQRCHCAQPQVPSRLPSTNFLLSTAARTRRTTARFAVSTRGARALSARFFTARHNYWPQTFHLGYRKPRVAKSCRRTPLHTYSPDYIRYLLSLIHKRRYRYSLLTRKHTYATSTAAPR